MTMLWSSNISVHKAQQLCSRSNELVICTSSLKMLYILVDKWIISINGDYIWELVCLFNCLAINHFFWTGVFCVDLVYLSKSECAISLSLHRHFQSDYYQCHSIWPYWSACWTLTGSSVLLLHCLTHLKHRMTTENHLDCLPK